MTKNSEDTLLIFQFICVTTQRILLFIVQKKMSFAESLDLTGALQKGMEQFTIMDFANNLTKEKHHIRFGEAEEMPSCSCHDWKKTGYLSSIFS